MSNEAAFGYSEAPEDVQKFHNQDVSYTGPQELAMSFDQAWNGTVVGGITRLATMYQTKKFAQENDASNIDVETLNKKYPNLEEPFTEPTNAYVAAEVARRQQEKVDLQDKINAGPQGGLYGVGRFGMGLLAHAADPLELAAMTATGGLSEAALGATTIGKAVGFGIKNKNLLQNFTTGAVEGTLGQAALSPVQYAASQAEMQHFDAKEEALNALAAGAMFGVIKAAAGAYVNYRQAKLLRDSSVGRLAADKTPNIEPLIKDFTNEKNGSVNPDYTPKEQYQFKPVDENTTWYSPKDSVQVEHTQGNSIPINDLTGDGIFSVDNPAVANGMTGSKSLDVPGTVHSLDISDLKMKDLGANPKMEDINTAEKEGFEGVHFSVTKTNGLEHEPFNGSYIFDPENPKIKQENVAKANTDAVSMPKQSEVKALGEESMSNKSDIFHDLKAQAEFDKTMMEPPKDLGQTEYEKNAQELGQQVQEQFKAEPENANFKEYQDLTSDADEKLKDTEKLIKGAINCLTRG